MSSQQEILSFEIVIDAKLSDDTKKNIEDLKSAKDSKGTTEEGVEVDDLSKEFSPEQLDQVRSTIGEELGGLDSGQLTTFGKMGKNPKTAVTKILQGIGGSTFAKILGPIGIALIAVEVTKEIIKLMSMKGGPLNRDWRRFIENEVAVGLSRQQQLEDRFGVSQTILTQIRGFAPNNENWTYNNLFDVNDERIARIGMSDREAGVTFFTP